MLLPLNTASDLQRLDQERLGLGQLPLVHVNNTQVVHEGGRAGILLPQDAAADFQRLDEERLGLGQLPLLHVQMRQVVHQPERLGVHLSQDVAADFQFLDKERFGLGILMPVHVQIGQNLRGGERRSAFFPPHAAGELQHPGEDFLRLLTRVLREHHLRQLHQRETSLVVRLARGDGGLEVGFRFVHPAEPHQANAANGVAIVAVRPEGNAGGGVSDGLGPALDLVLGEAPGEIEQGIVMIRLQPKCRLVGADRLVDVAAPAGRMPGQIVIPGRLRGGGPVLLLILGGRGGVPLSSPALGTHEIEGPRRLMEVLRPLQEIQASRDRTRVVAETRPADLVIGQGNQGDIGRLPDLLLLIRGQVGTLQARQPVLLRQDAVDRESLLGGAVPARFLLVAHFVLRVARSLEELGESHRVGLPGLDLAPDAIGVRGRSGGDARDRIPGAPAPRQRADRPASGRPPRWPSGPPPAPAAHPD